MKPSTKQELNVHLERLDDRKDQWVKTPIARRIQLLGECMDATLSMAPEMVAAACEAKGIPEGHPAEGEEWLGGPMTIMRNLRLLVRTLSEVQSRGAPALEPGHLSQRPDGQVKVKVCGHEDLECVAIVRDIMGSSASIRIDANGAFDPETAARFLALAAQYEIECVEQPIPRGSPTELAALRAATPVPVMADESLVTVQDARKLIEEEAVDYFNLRISKCGGLRATLAIAELAHSADIGIQLGCQVGETAILSAAGRHVAAHLEGLRFVEGSYGTHLLAEDIAQEEIAFGHGGQAPVLTGPGLGVSVREEVLDRYARKAMSAG